MPLPAPPYELDAGEVIKAGVLTAIRDDGRLYQQYLDTTAVYATVGPARETFQPGERVRVTTDPANSNGAWTWVKRPDP